VKTKLEELEKKEKELELSMDETREMVEDVKKRLDSVERWIAESERKERKKEEKKKEEEEKRRRAIWSVKNVLSASRVPGMLGLSAWFGVSSTSSTFSPSSSPSTPNSSKIRSCMTLVRRIAKLSLSLSTYAVLVGIGMCVMLLRALGKRPGVVPRFVGGAGGGARLGNAGVGR
jgi:hypothetical protein